MCCLPWGNLNSRQQTADYIWSNRLSEGRRRLDTNLCTLTPVCKCTHRPAPSTCCPTLTLLHFLSFSMASTPTKVNIILGLVLPVLLVLHLVKYLLTPIYRLLRSSRVPTVVRTPESRFGGLEKLGYPFAPNYYSIDVSSHQPHHPTCAGRLWGDSAQGALCGRGLEKWARRTLPPRRACLVLPLQEDGASPRRCRIQGCCS